MQNFIILIKFSIPRVIKMPGGGCTCLTQEYSRIW